MNDRFQNRYSTVVTTRLVLGILVSLTVGTTSADDLFDRSPINYSSGEVHDPVAGLQTRLAAGSTRLSFEPRLGYLRSVLADLKVPVASQTLVFSKTSFQQRLISPSTPRALYFNDTTYIGYVSGGEVLEIATVDPQQGAIFYCI